MLLSLCCSVVIMLYGYCVALLLFVLSYVLIVCTVPLPPGVNPIAVDKYINISINSTNTRSIYYEQMHCPVTLKHTFYRRYLKSLESLYSTEHPVTVDVFRNALC